LNIEAKVARVLNETEVALTAGSSDGVDVGDIATIYRSTTVVDPDTEEELGVVRRPALRLEIVEVQDRLSVGRTFELVETDALSSLAVGFSDPSERIVRVTRSASGQDWRTVFVRRGSDVEITTPTAKS
jgi:hypothetical protein